MKSFFAKVASLSAARHDHKLRMALSIEEV